MSKQRHNSESRTEDLILDLLKIQGWPTERPPKGAVIRQNEYKDYPSIAKLFEKMSKSGEGDGFPDFVLVDPSSNLPFAIIEAKATVQQLQQAIDEADFYTESCIESGYPVISIGIAGQDKDGYGIIVHKAKGTKWVPIKYNDALISWIPTIDDIRKLISSNLLFDLNPIIPSPKVIADKADLMNRILREASVKDEYRPAYVAAMMLALWHTKGSIRKDPAFILSDINQACIQAFNIAGKHELSKSIYVDERNQKLADTAWEIISTLEKLNVATAVHEHDYLGHLYESFFRYTGGNTIGQYFTPRHICRFMADICQVTHKDIVIDPACGTGGFLIAALQRSVSIEKMKYDEVVRIVRNNLIGFESEPLTASLCIANMILRGDGKSGIKSENCFTSKEFPIEKCDIALMNPPFPHKKTDTHPTEFVKRALSALHDRGKLAVILPTSTVVKREFAKWRANILKQNTLLAVCELPDEVFQPFASTTTCVVLFEKGIPQSRVSKTVFVRLEKDGLELKKGVRVPRRDGINQIDDAINCILNKGQIAGFSGVSSLQDTTEWAPGAYIPSAIHSEEDLKTSTDELLRRWSSFYSMYAPQISHQRELIIKEEIIPHNYKEMVSEIRLKNSSYSNRSSQGTVGAYFDIYYGQKELHSREALSKGDCLIISPTEQYNGTYGWLNFEKIMSPPFITVAQTGSIGEAFVQTEPCGVNDDCLILIPKVEEITIPHLFIVAATIRLEKWRFSYGRKLTPDRIKDFPIKFNNSLVSYINKQYQQISEVAEKAIKIYS